MVYRAATLSWTPASCNPLRCHGRKRTTTLHFALQRLLSNQSGPHVDLKAVTRPEGASVSILTLCRPPANVMGRIMLQELQDALHHIEQQVVQNAGPQHDTPRCLVLCSSLAPKVFSAGADLKERAGMSMDEAAQFVSDLRQTMQRVSRLPIPVVAAVDGVAVGGGLELALASDLRVAGRNAVMGLPETSLAIVPGAGGTQRLSRLIGVARAKELIYTARRIDAATAAKYGLVQHIVNESDESALDKALELAWEIAKNGPVAIQAAKWAMDRGLEAENMDAALEIEKQAYAKVLPTQDRLEGLTAFKEKRPPEYKGH